MGRIRHRIRLAHAAHPVLLLLAVGALAAAVTWSATAVQFDAVLGGAVRAAASGVVSHRLDFEASALAGTGTALPLTALAVLALWAFGHRRGALAVGLAVLATQALVDLIKGAVERPRPALNEAIADASGASFPSAHSATGMALYATLAFLAARSLRGPGRFAIAAAAAFLIAAIGVSRILLGAHYPSDVLAGWLTGAAVAVASWLAVGRLRAARTRAERA